MTQQEAFDKFKMAVLQFQRSIDLVIDDLNLETVGLDALQESLDETIGEIEDELNQD